MGKTAKRIILHTGLHKTGTTAIQNTLGASNKILQSQGWKYPIFTDGVRPRITNHSIPLYTLFCDDPSTYLPNLTAGINGEVARRLFAEQLQSELEGDYNLILSGEDVSALPESSLEKLANALREYDLLVITVVRESYSYFCSNLQHRIHRGVHGIRLKVPGLHQNCARLARIFPDINFLSYEQARSAPGGFFATFMLACGIDPSPFRISQANVSIGNHTARFLASFNDSYPLLVDRLPNPERPRFNVYDLDFDPFKFALTESEFEEIKENIKVENERLSSITGLPIALTETPCFSDSHPFTASLACGLLDRAAAMPAPLINHGFRYIADQSLAPEVWASLQAVSAEKRGLLRLWRRGGDALRRNG